MHKRCTNQTRECIWKNRGVGAGSFVRCYPVAECADVALLYACAEKDKGDKMIGLGWNIS